jgi:NADH-quinone oxidoreductase chain I
MLKRLKKLIHSSPLGVVGKHILIKPITVQYPEERLTLPDGYRGIHHFDIDRCMGCGICARVCPNKCIDIQVSMTPDKKKKIERYNVYLGRCMFCGLCQEFCVGKNVIRLTREYEAAGYTKKDLVYDIERLTQVEEGEK